MNLKDNEDFFVCFDAKKLVHKVVEENIEDFLVQKDSNSSGVVGDVSDGPLYKKLKKIEGKTRFVTLTLNTDGANVFCSNNKSLWPVQLISSRKYSSPFVMVRPRG